MFSIYFMNLCNFVEQSEEETEVVLDRIARVNNLKMRLNNNEVETNECMYNTTSVQQFPI
jgi:hypothetical protein